MSELELLWNGWRSEYLGSLGAVERRPGDGSVFAAILASGMSDEAANIIHRGTSTFVIMNLHPYSVGHMLVLPYRVISELDALDHAETTELWASVSIAARVARTSLRCGGVNVGLNMGTAAGGSIPEHLHVHVVPRWVGDANFMTATANTRTLPEALPVTAAKLRDGWPAA